jgi:CxxC-x17-CxxC domain-containing protein
MSAFKPFNKKSGFKKPFKKGGFGGGDRGEGRPTEMFPATCASCGKPCEVPFRPTGERPVYCRDCFGKTRTAGDAPRRAFENDRGNDRGSDRGYKPSSRPSFDSAPRERNFAPKPQSDDRRIDELKRQIDAVHNKLDVVVKMIEGLTPVVNEVVAEAAPAKPAKKATKAKAAKK